MHSRQDNGFLTNADAAASGLNDKLHARWLFVRLGLAEPQSAVLHDPLCSRRVTVPLSLSLRACLIASESEVTFFSFLEKYPSD